MAQPKILVVDDDQKFLHFVTEILIGAGYDVRGVEEPLTVVMMANEFQPQLIIMDIGMPGKDGFQLAADLRANANTSGIPCLFLTGRPANEGAQPAKETGAVGYLEKPVRSSTLLWTIKTLLGNKETQ